MTAVEAALDKPCGYRNAADLDAIIRHYWSFAEMVAMTACRKYLRPSRRDRLMSAAVEILWKCAEQYRVEEGAKFSTYLYASLWRSLGRLAWLGGLRARRLARRMVPFSDLPTDLLESLEARAAPDPELRLAIAVAAAELKPRSRTVFDGRYSGRPVETLVSLGAQLGVTRERVRQIQMRVLRDLRDSPALREYVPERRRR